MLRLLLMLTVMPAALAALTATAVTAATSMAAAAVAATATVTATPAPSVPVEHVQVRVVTGNEELTEGSLVELRIYEAGRVMRSFQLTHGATWPRDSTLLIPVTLLEPLDPRNVVRFALYYRAASPLTPPWEVVSADVELSHGSAAPVRLLNATLSGVIDQQGELATEERDSASLICSTDADCDDHKRCNGHERCSPHTRGADARGCVRGAPLVCPVNQVCAEGRGCVGLDAAVTRPATTTAPASAASAPAAVP
jgi:hypothetical protein